jgi:hypothetical protein
MTKGGRHGLPPPNLTIFPRRFGFCRQLALQLVLRFTKRRALLGWGQADDS